MKILQISDTHNRHQQLINLPGADVIVHCGDFTDMGTEDEVLEFLNWFIELPYPHKIFVTGNHDLCLWEADYIEGLPDSVHFLQDRGCEIEGIKFFGLGYNHPESLIPYNMYLLPTNRQQRYLTKATILIGATCLFATKCWKSNHAIIYLVMLMKATAQKIGTGSFSQTAHLLTTHIQ